MRPTLPSQHPRVASHKINSPTIQFFHLQCILTLFVSVYVYIYISIWICCFWLKKKTGCNVKATISVLKIPQVQGSLQHARKVALDQVAYESKARGLKSLKILGFSRCNEGTIGDGAVNNPNPTGCNVKATISVLKFPQVQGSLQHARKVALDQIAYEIEVRGLKSLKMLGLSRCNDGTIGDEAVNNPNPRGCIVIETIGV